MRSCALGLMVVFALCACTKLNSEAKDGGMSMDPDGGPDAAGPGPGGSGGSSGSGGTSGTGGSKTGGSGGSGGSSMMDAGGASGTDSGTDAMSGQPDGTTPACETEGELRCVGDGSAAREACQDGQWVPADSCADTEVCNGSEDVEPGTCTSLFELCIGHANEAVCVGADMHFCNEDSLSTHSESCGSERLCQAGVTAGACPVCLADTFQCSDRQLQKCAPSGMEWMDDTLCDTPELCNATSGACTDAACLPGDKTCDGDKLQQCKTDQSGYEDMTTCGAGLCDMVGKECDVCVPTARICNSGNDGYRVCNTNGQGYTDTACEAKKPYCTGNGTCVECTSPAQCTGDQCNSALCNAGTCGTAPKTSGTCTLNGGGGGVCNAGSCVECKVSGDCASSEPYCVNNVCRPCDGPCGVGAACSVASDCASNICTGGKCRPSCTGSCVSGDQCAVTSDCGSSAPNCVSGICRPCNGPCAVGATCSQAADCESNICTGGKCRPSCSGSCTSGQECAAASDCAASAQYCASNVCRPCNGACGIGASCNIASDCGSGVCTSGKCRPACSGSCAVGNACVTASDCASNECTSGFCTKTCSSVTLVTMADYTNNAECTKINGNLVIAHNSANKDPLFSKLTSVTGDVGVTYSSGTNTMTGLRLPAIKTIGGGVTLTATNVATINWPELTSIGGQLSCINMADLTSFETPKLTSIGDSVQFTFDGQLTRIDMRALRTVGSFFNILFLDELDTAYFNMVQDVDGSVNLSGLMHISYSALQPLWNAGDRSEQPQQIGCCLAGTGVTQSNCGDINIFSPDCQ